MAVILYDVQLLFSALADQYPIVPVKYKRFLISGVDFLLITTDSSAPDLSATTKSRFKESYINVP